MEDLITRVKFRINHLAINAEYQGVDDGFYYDGDIRKKYVRDSNRILFEAGVLIDDQLLATRTTPKLAENIYVAWNTANMRYKADDAAGTVDIMWNEDNNYLLTLEGYSAGYNTVINNLVCYIMDKAEEVPVSDIPGSGSYFEKSWIIYNCDCLTEEVVRKHLNDEVRDLIAIEDVQPPSDTLVQIYGDKITLHYWSCARKAEMSLLSVFAVLRDTPHVVYAHMLDKDGGALIHAKTPKSVPTIPLNPKKNEIVFTFGDTMPRKLSRRAATISRAEYKNSHITYRGNAVPSPLGFSDPKCTHVDLTCYVYLPVVTTYAHIYVCLFLFQEQLEFFHINEGKIFAMSGDRGSIKMQYSDKFGATYSVNITTMLGNMERAPIFVETCSHLKIECRKLRWDHIEKYKIRLLRLLDLVVKNNKEILRYAKAFPNVYNKISVQTPPTITDETRVYIETIPRLSRFVPASKPHRVQDDRPVVFERRYIKNVRAMLKGLGIKNPNRYIFHDSGGKLIYEADTSDQNNPNLLYGLQIGSDLIYVSFRRDYRNIVKISDKTKLTPSIVSKLPKDDELSVRTSSAPVISIDNLKMYISPANPGLVVGYNNGHIFSSFSQALEAAYTNVAKSIERYIKRFGLAVVRQELFDLSDVEIMESLKYTQSRLHFRLYEEVLKVNIMVLSVNTHSGQYAFEIPRHSNRHLRYIDTNRKILYLVVCGCNHYMLLTEDGNIAFDDHERLRRLMKHLYYPQLLVYDIKQKVATKLRAHVPPILDYEPKGQCLNSDGKVHAYIDEDDNVRALEKLTIPNGRLPIMLPPRDVTNLEAAKVRQKATVFVSLMRWLYLYRRKPADFLDKSNFFESNDETDVPTIYESLPSREENIDEVAFLHHLWPNRFGADGRIHVSVELYTKFAQFFRREMELLRGGCRLPREIDGIYPWMFGVKVSDLFDTTSYEEWRLRQISRINISNHYSVPVFRRYTGEELHTYQCYIYERIHKGLRYSYFIVNNRSETQRSRDAAILTGQHFRREGKIVVPNVGSESAGGRVVEVKFKTLPDVLSERAITLLEYKSPKKHYGTILFMF